MYISIFSANMMRICKLDLPTSCMLLFFLAYAFNPCTDIRSYAMRMIDILLHCDCALSRIMDSRIL